MDLEQQDEIVETLLSRSKEVFKLSIEIYNKPLVFYKMETFCILISNAWELMLKAKIVKDEGVSAIQVNKSYDQTISMNKTIRKIFNEEENLIRKNLEKVVSIRNSSIHYFVDELQNIYAPIFQACVYNYIDTFCSFFGDEHLSCLEQNFLMLPLRMTKINDTDISSKYSDNNIAEYVRKEKENLEKEIINKRDKYCLQIECNFRAVKGKNKAPAETTIPKRGSGFVELKPTGEDVDRIYPYTFNAIKEEINQFIKRENIPFLDDKNRSVFNRIHLGYFLDFYNVKENHKLSFSITMNKTKGFKYSQKFVEFIKDGIREKPQEIIEIIKNETKR